MGSTLAQIALAIAILGGAAVVTQLFARAMYITCAQCGTLNARRRVRCRNCGETLRQSGGIEG
jgi:ribosomal protein S27E